MIENSLHNIILNYWEKQDELTPQNAPEELKAAINIILDNLESGKYRTATFDNKEWKADPLIKQAILLYFKITNNHVIDGGFTQFYDKIPLQQNAHKMGARIVPPASIRRGAYIGPNTVIMPSFINIGAYVGEGSMIDTWATIGSCAQIGNHVHISGGVGIGGVLEPLQANPTIIEDNCFIGARSEIVEGVIVEQGAVISMGVFIGQSTRIYDREKDEIIYGKVPQHAVVVAGTLPGKNGKYALNCAIIVKRVDEKTRSKVGMNQILREAQCQTP